MDKVHKILIAEVEFWEKIISAWELSTDNQGYQSIKESFQNAQLTLSRYELQLQKSRNHDAPHGVKMSQD